MLKGWAMRSAGLAIWLLSLGIGALAERADRWRDPMPHLPDLSVTYIERTPRYPGSRVVYRTVDEPGGNKGDGLPVRWLNPRARRWPRRGEVVTFVAHVRSAGAQPTPRYDWHWLIDGCDVPDAEGWDVPATPGVERTYRLRWRWQTGRHHVAFEVNRGRLFDEITHKNNAVVDPTDALSFSFFVDRRVMDWFRGRKGGLDSYLWEDWAQLQVREMNREFRDEIHPSAPEGILSRVRLDRVTVLPDGFHDPGGTHAPVDNVTGGNDGVWGFTRDLLKPNADGLSFYEANPQWLLGPEWPLHHELGHQLGQPDYYLLPVTPERNAAAPGLRYLPAPWFQDQMMFSGNYAHDSAIGKGSGVWDAGYRFWGEHAARALNRDAQVRRGFFGAFLIDVPSRQRFVFLDERNRPVIGATVAMHVSVSREYGNARFDSKPDAAGRTDDAGAWRLSRSPWRVVLNWTSNGAIEFLLGAGRDRRIGFLNITDFNLAFWRGHRDVATMVVPTRLVPAAHAPK